GAVAAAKHSRGTAADVPDPNLPAAVRVLTSVQFMQGGVKIYESKPLIATEVNVPQRKAVEFQLDLPLQPLKPGFYTCQVNIIDDVSGNYAFPRWAMLIKEPPTSPPATPPSATGATRGIRYFVENLTSR